MLDSVLNEFATRLHGLGHVVIAGGAVRDDLMNRVAKDFDIFILQREYTKDFKDAVIARVADLPKVDPVVEWHKSEPFLAATVSWRDLEIQLLVNPASNPSELLDTFDWSCCLYSYDGSYIAREPIQNIKSGNELWLQKVTFPLSTLRRGFRFSERFKMKLKKTDIDYLCQQVIKKGANGN